MNEKEKKAMKYFYNLRATIDESNMLFDEDINVKCGKETIEKITTILNLIEKQQAEIEKKDKIIDLMAEHIAITGWANCPNEDCGANLDCENRCRNDEDIYVECWKMYFERKIEQ